MARLVKATCPQCGAGVQIDPAHDFVTCSYCGTSSFLRKSPTQSQPQAQPNFPPHYPVIDIAAGAKTHRMIWGYAIASLLFTVVAGAIPVVIQVVKASGAGDSLGLSGDPFNQARVADRAMLGDANGDGVADPLVGIWVQEGDQTVERIAALDAGTGKVIWTSDPVTKSGESVILAAAGGVLFSTKLALLDGVDLRSGKRLWEKTLPERIDRFCDDGRNGAAIVTRDQQVYGLTPNTGELSLKGKLRESGQAPEKRLNIAGFSPSTRKDFERRIEEWERARAAEFPCYSASSPDYWSRGTGVTRQSDSGVAIDGMHVDEVWQERDREPRFVIGYKQPGSEIPMIAAITAEGKLLWKAELPSKNPIGAKEGAPATFTLAGGRAIVGYQQVAENQLVVSAWALQTGQRYWEISLPGKEDHWAGIAVNDRHVFVKNHERLSAFALIDGRALWTFGKSD
jgi:outer membrane protein assembly factor BamB